MSRDVEKERNDRTKQESNLESAQEDQERTGNAGSNPDTTGPAENLRDKAAKAEDEREGSRVPA